MTLKYKKQEKSENELLNWRGVGSAAFGYRSYNPLEEAARKNCDDVRVIGGAVKAGNALTAVREGYEAALAL